MNKIISADDQKNVAQGIFFDIITNMNNAKLINLTPHDITILQDGGAEVTIPASGKIARVAEKAVAREPICGIPTCRMKFGEVTELPDPEDGVFFIVSALVRMALPGRNDLCSPGRLVRATDGQPIGCATLIVN